MNINIQGLRSSKIDLELSLDINKLSPAVMTICEHWLNESNYYVAHTIHNYKLISISVRDTKQKGGVCILVRNDIKATECSSIKKIYEESVFECVGVTLNLSVGCYGEKCLVVAIYRTPNSSFKHFIDKLTHLLNLLANSKKK